MKRRPLALLLASLGFAMAAAHAQPVDLSGVSFEPQLPLAGKTLVLNGAAIRYKAVVKVYAVGLYLTGKVNTAKAAHDMAGPKRVAVTMLRDISGVELGKSFSKNFEENATREDFMASIQQIARLGEVFAARKQLKTGDSFTLDWVPGTGTVLSINGQSVGEPFVGPGFYNGMLKLWIGEADSAGVRDALLGLPPKRQGRQRD
jgi:Chalcone isomerase-like